MNQDPLHPPNPIGRRQVLRQLAYMAGLSVTGVSSAQGSRPPLIIQAFLDDYQTDQVGRVRKSLFDSWAKHVQRQMVGSEVTINPPFPTTDAFKTALKVRSDCQVFPMYAYDFLEKRVECGLEALSMPRWGSGVKVSYEIFVDKDSQIKDVKDLKDKVITMEVAGRGVALPKMILDNLLRGKVPAEELNHYLQMKPVASALRAVLPVYFGDKYENKNSASACLISDMGVEEVLKLNSDIFPGQVPGQLSGQLVSIYRSKPLLTHVIACRSNYLTAEQKAEVRRISRDYIKTNENIPGPLGFEDYNADAERELVHEWDQDQKAKNAAMADFSEEESARSQASRRSAPPLPSAAKTGIAAPIQGQTVRPKTP